MQGLFRFVNTYSCCLKMYRPTFFYYNKKNLYDNSIKLTGDFKGMDFNLFPLYLVVTLSYLSKSNTCAPKSSHYKQLLRLTMHTRNKCTH